MTQKSTRGVQQEEVFAAADSLLAQQLRPTIERVRQKIGRGSPNTVAPMLEAWFASLGQRLGVVPEPDGQGVPASVRHAAEKLWVDALALAHDQAEAAMAARRQQLDLEHAGLTEARAALANQAAVGVERENLLRESLALVRRQLNDQTSQICQLQASLQQQNTELAGARGSIANLVRQKDTAEREHKGQIAALAAERERLQGRATANEHRWLEDVDRARQEVKVAHKALLDAEKQFKSQRVAHQKVVQEVTKSQQRREIEHASLVARLAASEQRAKDFQALLRTPAKLQHRRVKKAERTAQ